MRNYIILNNQNSNTISGLIIQELAPISKPLQRTQVETIDGRDGDIVTPLGYAAYNKKIKIGLYGNFDINEVIAYFATKGTVIFSNEPDKYYYYQIVDQIDYERLVRYRVATVTMHVQPFKYSATEGTITVDTSDTVSDEGSDIALDGTAEAPFNVLRHKGNATQKTIQPLNLYNVFDTAGGTVQNITVDADGWATCSLDNTSGTGEKYGFLWTNNLVQLQTNTNYAIVMEVKAKSGTGKIDPTQGSSVNSQMTANVHYDFANISAGQTYIFTQKTKADFSGTSQGLRTVVIFSAGQSGSITFRLSVLADTSITPQTFSYQPFVGSSPSPNPDYPQDIQVVTGDSTVKITGKNLFNRATAYENSGLRWVDGEPFAEAKSISSADYTPISAGQKVCLNYRAQICFYDISKVFLGALQNDGISIGKGGGGTFLSFTAPNITKIAFVRFGFRTGVNDSQDMNTKDIMVNLGATSEPYEPYIEQSYVLPLGDTYLAKIGDYADEPVNVDGTWYIRRKIGKLVFDSTNVSYISQNASNPNRYLNPSGSTIFTGLALGQPSYQSLCSHYTFARNGTAWQGIGKCGFDATGTFWLMDSGTSVSTLRAWLASEGVYIYYPLATPADEAITDQDLIDALDDFYDQAHAYKGHTHITAQAADGNAPAVLSVEVGEDNESTVTNAGNTTSRPILTIYGQGDIGVYINDVEVLDVALGDEEYITLDSVEMEAYKDTTANLKNRLVTGDYSKLALNAGDNKIYFTGTVTKYEISKYSRWL